MKTALTIIICLLELLSILCSIIVFFCIRAGRESDYHPECVKEQMNE